MSKEKSNSKLLELPDHVEILLYEIGNKTDFLSKIFSNLDMDCVELEETDLRGVGLILKEISMDIGKITATI